MTPDDTFARTMHLAIVGWVGLGVPSLLFVWLMGASPTALRRLFLVLVVWPFIMLAGLLWKLTQ